MKAVMSQYFIHPFQNQNQVGPGDPFLDNCMLSPLRYAISAFHSRRIN